MNYCLDTSGISNPWEETPIDIHATVWRKTMNMISDRKFVVTTEIYNEMEFIEGDLGECIRSNKANLILEVGDPTWDFQIYIGHIQRMRIEYHPFIFLEGTVSKSTVSLNDLSIIALAKTLSLPVVSMEKSAGVSPKRKRIPDVCLMESVRHLTFNDLMRAEQISA
jgi:hypothetical protein